jgi:hypothetical protein
MALLAEQIHYPELTVKRRLIVLYEKLPSQIMQTGMSHQAEKTY